jgi:hypothetical protein
MAGRNPSRTAETRTSSNGSDGSDGSHTAITTTRADWTSSQPTMTRRRSARSASVPASGPSSAGTKSPASSSRATARAWPVVSATCSIRATRPSESPAKDTVLAVQSRRNGRFAPSSRSDPAPAGPPSGVMGEILPDRAGPGR